MQLKDFIRETLIQIVEGVSLAQKEITNKGGNVNPIEVGFTKDGQNTAYNHAIPQDVHFDIVLAQVEGSGVESGIGVFLGSFGIGSKAKSDAQNASTSKIQFTIPLMLPPGNSVRRT